MYWYKTLLSKCLTCTDLLTGVESADTDLEELLLCMNELFALLDFTPHPFHLILVGLPWYHFFIGLQLILHLRCLANKNIYS